MRGLQSDQAIAAVDGGPSTTRSPGRRSASMAADSRAGGSVGLSALTRIAEPCPAARRCRIGAVQHDPEIGVRLQHEPERDGQERAQLALGASRRVETVLASEPSGTSSMAAATSRRKHAERGAHSAPTRLASRACWRRARGLAHDTQRRRVHPPRPDVPRSVVASRWGMPITVSAIGPQRRGLHAAGAVRNTKHLVDAGPVEAVGAR